MLTCMHYKGCPYTYSRLSCFFSAPSQLHIKSLDVEHFKILLKVNAANRSLQQFYKIITF